MEWKTPAPLFRDPVFDGSSDPTVIYNREEHVWWMFYTQRRSNRETIGVSSVFGTKIGIASSHDSGKTWVYRGTAQGLDIDWGDNTFWAPEVFFDKTTAKYHMIVTYIRGIPKAWNESNYGRNGMVHYTSENLWNWKYENFIFDNEHADIIDACVYPLDDKKYRMWYRDTSKGCSILYTDTEDFKTFTTSKVATNFKSEGPNVFKLGEFYYLISDPLGVRQGLSLHRSSDLTHWQQLDNILKEPGKRYLDDTEGRHADVVSFGNTAYIFYFTQPYRNYHKDQQTNEVMDKSAICVVQVAKLSDENGTLICDRNDDFDIKLTNNI